MAVSVDKRYLSEEEIDYLMNMSGKESEGEDPRNLCEIDFEILCKIELCENQGTDHADKDADYLLHYHWLLMFQLPEVAVIEEEDEIVLRFGDQHFFRNTINRNQFTEILRFLRFEEKATRSQRLKTDRFQLLLLYGKPSLPIACYVTNQYMNSKPDKFGIKFWLAVDTTSKYLVNSFPYLGRDEECPAGVPLAEHVVMHLAEP
ncbi:hypothetical protein ANN_15181 [Periplaneta americana]|uniref:PiggyBac transposable element-derived protein domain-containing protein n=1 Tax=Periplaneta americana TaxID=6978 RepID=A0ABQ8SFN6_PERAM|nr:hypothetical protein ANN_15181 [Periplaneta americana]